MSDPSPYEPPVSAVDGYPPAGNEPPVLPGTRPWGFWMTTAWGFVIALAWILAQVAVLVAVFVFMRSKAPDVSNSARIEKIVSDGDTLSVLTVVPGIVAIALILLVIWLSRMPIQEYLALKRPVWWSFFLWLPLVIGWGMARDLLAPHFNQEEIPEYMIHAYQSADSMILLVAAIVIIAPLFEELFFRGFLYVGWRRSPLRWVGTALLTSLLWASVHGQYQLFDLTWIFGFGLILCAAREMTGSLWMPIIMHLFNNGWATAITALHLAEPK